MKHKRFWSVLAALSVAIFAGCPLPPGDIAPHPEEGETHWLRFAHITDIHVIDEESPARFVRMESFIPFSWRPQDGYAPFVLDATLQRINALHAEGKQDGRPVDFVMVSGDLADSAHFNELRWFVDIMDGKTVCADSGAHDGVYRPVAPEDNPKLAFDAVGLDPDILWYAAVGNHDLLASGNFSIDQTSGDPAFWYSLQLFPVAHLLGLHDIGWNWNGMYPTAAYSPAVFEAAFEPIDPVTLQLDLASLEAGFIVPDPNRHYISERIFIDEMFNSDTMPPGHGFTETNRRAGTAYYSVRPNPSVPIRLIVLDTVAPAPPEGIPVDYGVMMRGQFDDFFEPELARARNASEYVIVVTHNPSEDFDAPYPGSVKAHEFRNLLASQPNVLAHICGHTHNPYVGLVDGSHPYAEIVTSSLIDLPQEGRMIDVFYNASMQRFRIEGAPISHMDAPTRLSAESHRRAQVDAAANGLKADAVADTRDLFAGQGPEVEAMLDYAAWTRGPHANKGATLESNGAFSVTVPAGMD